MANLYFDLTQSIWLFSYSIQTKCKLDNKNATERSISDYYSILPEKKKMNNQQYHAIVK